MIIIISGKLQNKVTLFCAFVLPGHIGSRCQSGNGGQQGTSISAGLAVPLGAQVQIQFDPTVNTADSNYVTHAPGYTACFSSIQLIDQSVHSRQNVVDHQCHQPHMDLLEVPVFEVVSALGLQISLVRRGGVELLDSRVHVDRLKPTVRILSRW